MKYKLLILWLLCSGCCLIANANVNYFKITTSNAFMYANPMKNSTIVYSTSSGNTFLILEEKNNFIRIAAKQNISAWVSGSSGKKIYLKIAPAKAAVNSYVKQKPVYKYSFSGQEDFRFPRRETNQFFDINVDGFYEIKASGRSVNPNDMSSPIWQAIVNDSVYQKIPRNVLMGPIQLDYRSQINLEGKLSNDLHVYLDIEQETNMPHKMDVEVKYKDHFLDFFDYEASYNQGSFFKVNKSVRGAQYQYSKDKDFFQLSTGKERSKAQAVEGFGTGRALIKLAHKYIYPNSIYIYKNNKKQSENNDYIVNYYSGEVTFSAPLQTTDYYKIIYEFSNPIADFLPVLSRRNFIASQYTKKPQTIQKTELSTHQKSEDFIISKSLFTPVFPTFNYSFVESYPSFNLTLFSSLNSLLVSHNILTTDYYISKNFRSTHNIRSLLDDAGFSPLSSSIKSSLINLYNKTQQQQRTFDLSFSTTQVFPDAFILIDNISLQDSVDLFYALINKKVLNSQGYIAQNIFSFASIFEPSSSFFLSDSDILLFLKTKILEKSPSSRPSYILKNSPILLGSEKVYINNTFVERNKDYILDNSLGIINFLIPITASENISMTYSYFEKKSFSEELLGKNSIGPYLLSHSHLIKQSLRILLNNRSLQEIRDYIVNYEKGEVFFNFEISYPDILSFNYDYMVKNTKETISQSHPFEISTTFIQEYVSPDDESAVIQVASENVVVSNNTVILSNSPLINTANISISMSGTTLANSTFEVSNYYRSEIAFTGINIADNTSIQVSYDYQKSHRTKFIFLADGRNTAYNVDGTEFIFRDIPIKYNSVVSVTKFDGVNEIKLEEETDYDITYSDYGDFISIVFYTTNENGNSAKLDIYPQPGERITILYDFSPSSIAIEETVYHQMIGTSIKTTFGNNWELDSEIVVAKNNYGGKVFEGELQNLSGTGILNDFYYIGQQNIVENSEQIFLNGISQTKDKDYVVIYKNGTFRFRELTVMPEDKIDAYFKYEDSSGTVSAGTDESSYATRFKTSYQVPSFNFDASFKYIDKEFEPIGNISEPNGSTILDSSINWKSSNTLSLASDFSHYKTFVKTNSDNKDIYLKSNIINTSLKSRLFNYINSSHVIRYQNNLQDPDTIINNQVTRDQDSYLYSYSGNFIFGPKHFNSDVGYKFSKQEFDYKDNLSPKDTTTKSSHFKSALSLQDVFLLGTVNFSPNYYYSYSETNESVAPTFNNTEHYNLNLISTIKPLNSLLITPKATFSKTSRQTSSITSANTNEAKSYSVSSSFSPYSWVSTSASFSHNETESPLLGQQSNLDQIRSASIPRLAPYAGVRKLGFSKDHYFSKMFYPTNVGFYYSDSTKKTNNHNNIHTNDSNRVNINSIIFLQGLSLEGLSYSESNSDKNTLVNSYSVSENETISNTKDYAASLSFRPSIPVLNYFKFSSSLRDSISDSTTTSKAYSVTGNQTVNSVSEDQYDYNINFNSPQFYIKNPFFKRKRIRLGRGSINYSFDNLSKRNSQNIYDILYNASSLNFSQVSTSNETVDNQDKISEKASLTISPLNIISISSSWSSEENYLNRNKFVDPSSVFQNKENIAGSTSFSPLSFLSFSVSAEKTSYTQWKLPSINISSDELQSTSNSQLSKINNISEIYSVTSTFSPFRFLSLNGDIKKKLITEKNTPSLSSEINNEFNVLSATAGASFYPLRDMSVSYAYTLENTDGSESITNSLTFNYTPAKSSNKKININFKYDKTKGTGLNTLNQTTTSQGTGEIIASEVVLRENEIYYGSINVSYIYPINKVIVQNFTLDIEGYVKSIKDKINDSNNYTINGVIAKGVLTF
jgi:hypothetical protein